LFLNGRQAVAIGARARQLRDLVVVHEYFLALLEKALGYGVLVPQQLQELKDQPRLDETLRCWLGLLDRAVTPQMLREGLQESDMVVAEALLCYLVSKQSLRRVDRDKTDLVATLLYKEWSRSHKPQPVLRTDAFTTPDFARVPEFAGPLYAILCDIKLPELPEEHRLRLREFPFVRQEVDELRSFNQLMDSGLVERVRDIKESFGGSTYHPYVLAAFAEYNVVFGQKFDQLFHKAVCEIKAFAASVEFREGSGMARVSDNIPVKHMTEVEEDEILSEEYERARAEFQKVSTLTKAVDRSRGKESQAPGGGSGGCLPQRAKGSESTRNQLEESLRDIKEASITCAVASSIRKFVRAANSDSLLIVPLPKGNFALTAAEWDAFGVDYAGENSFRATYAATMVEIVSTTARLCEELGQLKEKRDSAYLWVPHADALAYLLKCLGKTIDSGTRLVGVAEQRGLKDKTSAMTASLEKLRATGQQVSEALQALGTSTATNLPAGRELDTCW
jgi:hypothetical protein